MPQVWPLQRPPVAGAGLRHWPTSHRVGCSRLRSDGLRFEPASIKLSSTADYTSAAQFETALRLSFEVIERCMVLHHEVGKEFQRNIALQFFIARQPDYSHSTSSEDLDQRVAAKDLLSADKLTRCHRHDVGCPFVAHFEQVKVGRKLKANSAVPTIAIFTFARRNSVHLGCFASGITFDSFFPRERAPRGRCLVGSGRWHTPSDPR